MISTIITRATIVDGSGRPPLFTDVALQNDRIARIGSCDELESVVRIDGATSVLAPGLIDACSHADDGGRTLPTWNSSISQGITTTIACVCGRGSYEAPMHGFATPHQSVREACEAGALGVSLDLSLTSAGDARMHAEQAKAGGAARIAVHLRSYARDLTDALDEALALARSVDMPMHISHLQCRGGFVSMERVLERIDRERARGAAITCDVYPYVAAWIDLASLLPPALKVDALDDERVAAAVALEMEARLGDVWHELMLADLGSEERMAWCGMRFDEIGAQMRLRPARAVLEFIRSDGDRAHAFFFTLREDDIATALTAHFCAIGTSAPAYDYREERFGLVHPRAFGSMPRVIGRFVRQRRVLTLEEAVYRMSGLPARIFGLDGFGELREGARADLIRFDERGFVDTATYERPVSAPAGLKDVWIAGVRKGP